MIRKAQYELLRRVLPAAMLLLLGCGINEPSSVRRIKSSVVTSEVISCFFSYASGDRALIGWHRDSRGKGVLSSVYYLQCGGLVTRQTGSISDFKSNFPNLVTTESDTNNNLIHEAVGNNNGAAGLNGGEVACLENLVDGQGLHGQSDIDSCL